MLTVDLILSWRPYWDEACVRATCAPLGDTFTAADVLRLGNVTVADRLWVVLRPEAMDDRVLRLFAVRCARRALERARAAGREPDARSWAACEVAERYALGEATEDDLVAARAAARAASWAGASDAARDASWAASWAGARDAAWDAARAAARDGASTAEEAQQVADLLELLEV